MAERCAAEMQIHEEMHGHWRSRAEHWLAQSDRWANVAILAAARRANKVATRHRVHLASQRIRASIVTQASARTNAAVSAANDTDRNGA